VQVNDTTPADATTGATDAGGANAGAADSAAVPAAAAAPEATNVAAGVMMLDDMTMVGPKSFVDGYEPVNADGTVNAVIEIPTGSVAKWEVHSDDGNLHWDVKDGKPRLVEYLGYPTNYGMVPRTRLDEATLGGDGDPLDILLLGDALPRGSVVPVKVIGVVKFTDSGERDDKLLVVRADTPFFPLNDVSDLQSQFPGVTNIIATWFLNYKGPDVFQFGGYGGAEEAKALLDATIEAYANPAPAEDAVSEEAATEGAEAEQAATAAP
jgi:inorganic pyrophosphatase